MSTVSTVSLKIHSGPNNQSIFRKACESLDGVFAFVMADQDKVYIGRDPMGVRPLFYGFATDGTVVSLSIYRELTLLPSPSGALVVGSEVKCISPLVERIEYFPPGSCATFIPAAKTRALQVYISSFVKILKLA